MELPPKFRGIKKREFFEVIVAEGKGTDEEGKNRFVDDPINPVKCKQEAICLVYQLRKNIALMLKNPKPKNDIGIAFERGKIEILRKLFEINEGEEYG